MSAPVQLWPFDGAPQELAKLTQHGGDEDWVMLIPAEYISGWTEHVFGNADEGELEPTIGPSFWQVEGVIERLTSCDVQFVKLVGGDCLAIGAHS